MEKFGQYNVTPWFPISVKPVRKGVYLVRVNGGTLNYVSYWNGKKFCWVVGIPIMGSLREVSEEAVKRRNAKTYAVFNSWRGIAK